MEKKLLHYSLALICFIAACHMTRNVNVKNFDLQGHRGSRGLMPENTIPAMYKAIDLGVTTLEMDVVISEDRQVVLSHDPFMSHFITTKPDGTFINEADEKSYLLFQMPYDSIRKYDVGLKPHPRFPKQQKMPAIKPLLSDLIDSVDAYAKRNNKPLPLFNIETKSTPAGDGINHPEVPEFVDLLMKVINQKGIAERVTIQSFDFRTLIYLHNRYPSINTAALVEANDPRTFETQMQELGFVPTIYSPNFQLVNEVMIRNCQARGMKIIPWTVNEQEKFTELRRMGVDGIITDYPDLKH